MPLLSRRDAPASFNGMPHLETATANAADKIAPNGAGRRSKLSQLGQMPHPAVLNIGGRGLKLICRDGYRSLRRRYPGRCNDKAPPGLERKGFSHDFQQGFDAMISGQTGKLILEWTHIA